MQPIYKVVDKELNERIKKAKDKVTEYMTESLAKAQELLPQIENIAIRKCPLSGKHTILGFTLKEDADKTLFKKWGDAGPDTVYTIKRSTKKGKELAKELNFVGKAVMLFDEQQFEEELGYKPEKREIFSSGYMTVNYLRFGFVDSGEDVTFVYKGYTGYTPSEKAQEMTISEYNKMFGR